MPNPFRHGCRNRSLVKEIGEVQNDKAGYDAEFINRENKIDMKRYYRVMLGAKSVHADECLKGNFIGVGFGINIDLRGKLYDNWRDFNKEFIPVYLQNNPDKKKVAAGLACATILRSSVWRARF